jgi:cytochrome c biogenesis protein CcmG, thiol:disulfide interchange protein DsbE
MLFAIVGVLVPVAILGYGLRANPRAVPSPMVGQAAPDFGLRRLDGPGDLRLTALRGQVVVVNFWASWCVPCREEAEALEAVWQRYRGTGVQLVGVNIQDREAAAKGFLAETKTSFPNVTDGTGATSIAYGIYGVPETFVVDRRGRITERFVGAVTTEWLTARIDAAMRSGS